MISRREAEQFAAAWAYRDSLARGDRCRSSVKAFDLGYLIRVEPARRFRQSPGDRRTTVVDRATGELSHWPALPSRIVVRQYQAHRSRTPDYPRTADPAAELRRLITRRPTPTTVATLMVGRERITARGAKGDQVLDHHPLIQRFFRQVEARRRCRGMERHAELIVLSDALHREDWRRVQAGYRPLEMSEAVQYFAGNSLLECQALRDDGDEANGPTVPCPSCLELMVTLGVLPAGYLTEIDEIPPPSVRPGWLSYSNVPLAANGYTGIRQDVNFLRRFHGTEYRHTSFPAAVEFLGRGVYFSVRRSGPGTHHRIQPLVISPRAVPRTADTLGDFARVIGCRLFPVGAEQHMRPLYRTWPNSPNQSIIAVDERGRIFVLDQAGEWYLGANGEEGLTNLVLGGAARRVRDDGTW